MESGFGGIWVYFPEGLGLFESLTVIENLMAVGPIYGLTMSETAARAADLLGLLDLTQGRHTVARNCSFGMRKKTALAMALLHKPRFVLLDEPFEGIDPAYRLFGRAPEPTAFPVLSLVVGIAMSTVAQRMQRLDEGRALLRYRLLPIAGWMVTQDMTFLIPLAVMVSLLSLRTGVSFGLVALAVGRYPSLGQRANQRRWRFVGGDPRFGVAQVLLGGFAGIGAARSGLWVLAVAFAIYLVSIFWGEMLWKRSLTA